MIKSFAKLTATTALIFGSLQVGTAMLDAHAAPTNPYKWGPCTHEDGPGPCVWDARHEGNGEGRSLLITRKGKVIFIPHSAAHQLLRPPAIGELSLD